MDSPQNNISPPLPPLPMFYTSTPNTSLRLSLSDISWEVISSRLFGALKRMSLHSSCNPTKASIYCVRGCYDVEFRICFFAEDPDTVLVDMLRIRGCTMLFHRDAAAIIRALKGLPPLVSSPPNTVLLVKLPPSQPHEEQLLHRVHELLGKDRLDAQLLGMESLYRLFSSSGSSRENALQYIFAHKVYRSDNSISSKISGYILDMILSLIATRKLNVDDDDEEDEYFQESFNPQLGEINYSFVKLFAAKMHLMSLQVLSSMLEVALSSDIASNSYNTWLHDTLLPTLLQGLHVLTHMEVVPMHGAYLLTKCLRLAVQSCRGPLKIDLSDAKNVLETSWYLLGVQSHSMLEEECRAALDVLGALDTT
jgi:hypothetical protein